MYGGGIIPSPIISLSLSKLSWLVAIDGSELAFTKAGKLPNDSDPDGPGLSSKSDSGLDAYERRDVFMGKRKSSERDSTGWGWDGNCERRGGGEDSMRDQTKQMLQREI